MNPRIVFHNCFNRIDKTDTECFISGNRLNQRVNINIFQPDIILDQFILMRTSAIFKRSAIVSGIFSSSMHRATILYGVPAISGRIASNRSFSQRNGVNHHIIAIKLQALFNHFGIGLSTEHGRSVTALMFLISHSMYCPSLPTKIPALTSI